MWARFTVLNETPIASAIAGCVIPLSRSNTIWMRSRCAAGIFHRSAVFSSRICFLVHLTIRPPESDSQSESYPAPSRDPKKRQKSLDSNSYGSGMTHYIGILQEAGTFAVPKLRRQAVIHIHDLIALAIGATRDAAEIAKSRGAPAARLRAIKEDIANRLDQPGLSVAIIAARHRIKPRGSSGCSKARARPSLSMCSRSALPR